MLTASVFSKLFSLHSVNRDMTWIKLVLSVRKISTKNFAHILLYSYIKYRMFVYICVCLSMWALVRVCCIGCIYVWQIRFSIHHYLFVAHLYSQKLFYHLALSLYHDDYHKISVSAKNFTQNWSCCVLIYTILTFNVLTLKFYSSRTFL